MFVCNLFSRTKLEVEEAKVFKNLNKCTKMISNASLDQSAYYKGLSKLKGIDLAQMKKEARAEVESDDDDDEEEQKPRRRGKFTNNRK